MKRFPLILTIAAALLLSTLAYAGVFQRLRDRRQSNHPQHEQQSQSSYQYSRSYYSGPQKASAPLPAQQMPQAGPAAQIKWQATYEDAINQGAADGKTVVVLFTSKNCIHCPAQEAAFMDQRVVAAVGDALAVRVDIDGRQDLKDAYRVDTVPAVAFVAPDGKTAIFEGVMPAEKLLAKLAGGKQAAKK